MLDPYRPALALLSLGARSGDCSPYSSAPAVSPISIKAPKNPADNPGSNTDEMVVVGRIGSPYGVRGWVRVTSYTEPLDNLLQYKPWMVAGQTLTPVKTRAHQGGFVAQIAQVGDRDEAALLAGQDIQVHLNQLPAAEEGEFYWRDLIGMQARDPQGQALGEVTQLLETGVHDVLVITTASGREVLVPFVKEFVQDVDSRDNFLTVDWPEFGLD